jgi:hypothetical protein
MPVLIEASREGLRTAMVVANLGALLLLSSSV